MLIFIDESGDAGFKFGNGSTDFFVISAVVFDSKVEVERVSMAIKNLRCRLGFSSGTEFKFNGSRSVVVIEFLRAINVFDFRIRSLVINKVSFNNQQFENDRYPFIIRPLRGY